MANRKFPWQVLQSAADYAGLEVVNVRIGQLCGSRSTGDWNPTDWFPILVASSKYLACLPKSEDVHQFCCLLCVLLS